MRRYGRGWREGDPRFSLSKFDSPKANPLTRGPLPTIFGMSAPWPMPPLPALTPLLMPALQDRLVLLINHVLSREPVA